MPAGTDRLETLHEISGELESEILVDGSAVTEANFAYRRPDKMK